MRHGSRRTLVAQIASHVVSLIVLASLYHLVAPGDFGLMGMVLPVIMFLRIFTSLGMNIATVQSRESDAGIGVELVLVHIWRLGFATALAAIVIAPGVAWFYGEPDVTTVTDGARRPRRSQAPWGCSTSRSWSGTCDWGAPR